MTNSCCFLSDGMVTPYTADSNIVCYLLCGLYMTTCEKAVLHDQKKNSKYVLLL